MQDDDRRNAVQRGGFDPNTVFERILAGELPAAFVYRDEHVSAFMDIQPINPGHVLVVPNERAATLAELPPDTAAHMFRVGQRIAAAIRASALRCEGVNLFLADGVAAGQTVFHMHLHVFPRFDGDGFQWKLPAGYHEPPGRADIEAVCADIRAALDN
ncbi:MAG: HIT family protein [Gammaproteobacteria bacterium]